jgi:hypothetical protein
LFAVWLAHDTGRSERRHGRADARSPFDHWAYDQTDGTVETTSITDAVLWRRPHDAVALALAGDSDEERRGVTDQLLDAALADRAGSFIVLAHLVKTSQAAVEEAEIVGSPIPVAAAARFLASPRLERFVARAVSESADFVRTGAPPKR